MTAAGTLIPQDALDALRARHRLSDAVRRRTKLRKAGAEWAGLCPFHSERSPSFFVNDVKGFAHCFGCGWHGDIIRFVRDSERVGFREAVAMIDAGALPVVDPAELAKARSDDERAGVEHLAAVRRFWDEAVPVAGTPADLYLTARGIHVRPDTIRFGRVPSWRDKRSGAWGPSQPALLLGAEDLGGGLVGLQRIFLTEDGRKAAMRKPKLSLGSVRGASIRFGHVRPEATLTGGPEDGLSLWQRFSCQVTVYVACGESNLPFILLPSRVRQVTIARQNDAPGRAAAIKACELYREQGREVRLIAPDQRFKDWNDQLLGRETEDGRRYCIGP